MQIKEILNNNLLATNLFYFAFSVAKTQEDGTTKTTSYVIDIPDIFATMYCGERKTNDYISDVFADDTLSDVQKYGRIAAILSQIKESCKYKWGALIDSLTLYYNPLWNVDGTEKTTRDYGIDKTTFVGGSQTNSTQHGQQQNTMVYGQDQQSMQYGQETNTLQHGAATDSVQYGAHETERTHKTNPFNDSDTLYSTDVDIENSKTHTDTTTRGTYTDTETRNTKTDTQTRNTHTDTNTLATYTDTDTIGAKTDSNTRDARKDTETTERHGNIGVTKSTELLKDARELAVDYYPIILNDVLKYISVGW